MLGDRPGLSQPALTTGSTHTLAAGLPRSGFVHGRKVDQQLDWRQGKGRLGRQRLPTQKRSYDCDRGRRFFLGNVPNPRQSRERAVW